MAHRTVSDVMTAEVATIDEDAPFKELVSALAERGVSALPILDAQGRVSGVVSEIDLLRKEEYRDEPGEGHPSPWRHRGDRARAAGLTARDVMTAPPVTISPDASIVTAARMLHRHGVRRLVVLDADGWLAGIVTPSDLLKVYLRSDDDIRAEVLDEVITDYLGANPDLVRVAVSDGVVTLGGTVASQSMMRLAGKMARSVDGVVDVVNHLSC
ncbi:MAG: CBS domain-containing protein [Streptosporangiaceae bacterium]|jgi:CBS domain-containing protein|nr:hypothetical protein [Actinomycetota bacterium]